MTGPVPSGDILTVRVPMTFERRGGRKAVIVPQAGEAELSEEPQRPNNVLVKALARAFRWRKLMESGEFTTVADLAKAEKVNQSYLCRILRLTLLSPTIVHAISEGRIEDVPLGALLRPFPVTWSEQSVE